MKVSPRWFWLASIFLITQFLYLHTLNPAFSNDDSAETITAGETLGLQHPPGYALAAVVGRWEAFLPLGGFGFRANWGASLLASAGAVLLVFILFSILDAGWFLVTVDQEKWVIPFCAVTGGLWLAFSPTYWQNALSAKGGIYLLSICLQLFILVGLIHTVKKADGATVKILGVSFFLTGLGLANHWETLIIFIPALFLFFILTQKTKWTHWLKAATYLILGFSPLIYLPLRAHLNPSLNLGEPDTISYFWEDLSRNYFSYREASLWNSLAGLLKGSSSFSQFLFIVHQIIENKGKALLLNLGWDIGWLSFGLALLGIWIWGRSSERRILFFILLSWILLWGSIFSYYDISSQPDSLFTTVKFFLSSDWMIFLLAAIGLFFFLSKIFRRKRWAGVLAAMLMVLYLILNVKNDLKLMDQRQEVVSYDYGQNLLKSLPPNALFFAESDEDYFSLYYLQQVEHRRPDVLMIPTFTLFEGWGTRKVEKEKPDLGLTASSMSFPDHFARIIYATSEIVVKNRNKRPIGFSNFNGAFHRYYLDRQKNLKIRFSGLVWLFDNRVIKKTACLTLSQLRIRGENDISRRVDGSLDGIGEVYTLAGLRLTQ